MDLQIKGRVALVVASSLGLGKGCAQALVREGVHVACCARNYEILKNTIQELKTMTTQQVVGFQADVTKPEDIESMVRETNAHLGGIDILVNNAGGPPYGEFDSLGDQDWEDAIQLNLMSAIRFTRLVLPGMREREWGRIINITSIAAKEPVDGMMLSNSIRGAVHGFAKTLAREVAEFGITVNCVMPGSTKTDRINNLAKTKAHQTGITIKDAFQSYTKNVPMGRLGRPDELGSLVAYLSSNKAAFISGVSIAVDGGTIRSVL